MNYYYAYGKKPVNGVTYFLGENSGDGFIGGYPSTFDERELDRLYIIKGAAGTGKNTFMRKVADESERLGHSVVRYLCGSDPDSLDCVIIDGKVAVADGTAPHVLEMKYPGAASEIIDVTCFWDKRKLMGERNKIIELSEEKGRCFRSAYKALKAVELLKSNVEQDISSAFDFDKAESFIARMIKGFGKGDGGNREKRNIYAVSMKGSVRLTSLDESAETIYSVVDCFGSAMLFMKMLSQKLDFAGFGTVISNDPMGGGIRDILVPSRGVLITVVDGEEPSKQINMKRFVNKERLAKVRGSIRLTLKCRELFEEEIATNLKEAGAQHFGLEEIYGKHMDFTSLSEFTERKKREIIMSLDAK